MATQRKSVRSRMLLAIDQGTTSSRALVIDSRGTVRAIAQKEFPQLFPNPGWVEHDPEDIWRSTLSVSRQAIRRAGIANGQITAIGIANQRETTLIWDRTSGKPVYNAIVWQDRRTADWCRNMQAQVGDSNLSRRTGLLFDPYFSASKIAWILDNVAGARRAAEQGRLAFGTVDTFLLWRLTGGRVHATDATNASRTMLFNLAEQDWDDDLLREFRIPRALLPDVHDSASQFGLTDHKLFNTELPVCGMIGDQQAALVGQACFKPGMIKSTYGTGCFVVMNTGARQPTAADRLIATIAYRLGGKCTYALEGSIFVAGAAIQWLRDELGLVHTAAQTAELAAGCDDTAGMYFVPAFTGLGAPHWDPDARGAFIGLTRRTGRAEIVRAALEAVAYQTRDLMTAMNDAASASKVKLRSIRVDGGMAANNWVMQFLADQLRLNVERPQTTETTALGAAYMAGLGSGLFTSLSEVAQIWQSNRTFRPIMRRQHSDALYAGWQAAIRRVLSSPPIS